MVIHHKSDTKIAELISKDILIGTLEQGVELLGNMYFQGFHRIVLKVYNITPLFFDLRNGFAGEILQKFSNYRMELTIIGDHKQYETKSLKDFVRESNEKGNIKFVANLTDALG